MSRLFRLFLVTGVLGLFAVPSFAPIFMKIDGIQGASTQAGHPGWIDLESFQWGVGRAITPGPACRGTHLVSIVERGKASPGLAQLCQRHAMLPYLTLDLNGERHMLQNVTFQQCQEQQLGGGLFQETITLNFTRCATHDSEQSALETKQKVIFTGGVKPADKTAAPNAIIAVLIGNTARPQALTLQSLMLNGGRASLVCRKAGGEQDPLGEAFQSRKVIPSLTITTSTGQKWTFTNVTVSQVNWGDRGQESLSLNFTKVEGPAAGFRAAE